MMTRSVLDLLAWAVGLGSTAAGIVLAVRALPAVRRAMVQLKKPWACDLCMSFWTVGALSLGLAVWKVDAQLLLSAGPAYPLALQLLRMLQEPANPPSPLPPLEE